jgi:hypothetical protein
VEGGGRISHVDGRDRASVPGVTKSPLSAQRLSAVPLIDV